MTAIAPLGPGSVLGKYRLECLVGAGLTSMVYEGVNLVSRKPCTVKVFRRELLLNKVSFGRYVHTTHFVAQLSHPDVADVYYSGSAKGHYFSVVDVVQGIHFRALAGRRPVLRPRTLLRILRRIADALSAVHAAGEHHGRLHWGQVMIHLDGPSVEVKVLDFGVRHLQPGLGETLEGWERGPFDAITISPEQAKGGPGDARSDVYALAVMLYEMVTRRLPFLGDSFSSTLEMHIKDDPIPPGKLLQLPQSLDRAILRGLEKDPARRTLSVEALLAGLHPSAKE